jgi:Cd(II)/Pb(II)-responsive transcriptional regulator
MSTLITIGHLAARTQSSVQTVRYYERVGLLAPPARSAGNYRQYGQRHVERLLFVRHCRSLDLSLAEIRALLALRDAPAKSCHEVNTVVDAHIDQVTRRIAELRRLQQQLKALRARCGDARVVKDCQILGELSRRASPQDPVRTLGSSHRKHEVSRRVLAGR